MERVSTMMAATAVTATRDTAANFAKVNFREKKRMISHKMYVCKNIHAARPLYLIATNYRGRRVRVIAVPRRPVRV